MMKFLLAYLISALTVTSTRAQPGTVAKKETAGSSAGGFTIKGTVEGFANGTKVALLNGQTGAPEEEGVVTNNQFTFKGTVTTPDFKIILFNNQPPFITIFLDNSVVNITGKKESIETATVTGSASHTQFQQLNNELAPFQNAFAENAPFDSAAAAGGLKAAANFVKQHPGSFVAPLAIIRYSQLTEETCGTEALYNQLSPAVKQTPMGEYVAQQLAEAKKNAIGTVLADFAQADTTGKPVSLASYRGKYVLIDFWASWCKPCRQENPNVVANYNKFKDKNFTVLGVSLDKAKPAWVDAIRMDGLTWGHVSDLQGWTNSVAQQFQIQSIPQNFLIGPDGKILAKNLRGPALEKKLTMLLQ